MQFKIMIFTKQTPFKEALDNDAPEVLSSLAENLTGLGFTDLTKKYIEL